LGSTYFQNIGFLDHLDELQWSIVEQNHFVDIGKKQFENDSLKFYKTIEECFKKTTPRAVIISGTIQYMEKPYLFIEKLMEYQFDYIIFARTNFLKDTERIAVQKVPPNIYPASFPVWFLNEKKFLDLLEKKYVLKADFDTVCGIDYLGDPNAVEKGFFFVKKS